MTSKPKEEAQNPLILRCHRLIEAFGKSNDERDFYLDRNEGFLLYCNLDKSEEELQALEEELKVNSKRYCLIPKLTFYETKKIMEGFVNEKVYDIDTKEKLLDIIQSKEARENFLEFIYDHHSEFEKWQQFYHERSRIRIIEWLRANHFHFVFEEDLDMPASVVEKLKHHLFETKVSKDILTARKHLASKAKTYYSNEALNPRPKRGRPPKQTIKQEIEPQFSGDIFLSAPSQARPFLFSPETTTTSAVNFSAKFDGEDELLPTRRQSLLDDELSTSDLNSQLSALRELSSRWTEKELASQAIDKKTQSPSLILKSDKPSKMPKSMARNATKTTNSAAKSAKMATKAPTKTTSKTTSKPVLKSLGNTSAKTAAKATSKNKSKSTAKVETLKKPVKAASKKTTLRSIVNPKAKLNKATPLASKRK